MFTFYFLNKTTWLFKRFFSAESTILWKLTMMGPYVTLYAANGYGEFNFESVNYQIIMPHDEKRHLAAHGENILGKLFDSNMRHTHSHFVLPCERDLVLELKELLLLIGKNNNKQKYINTDLIDACVTSYQTYLSKTSADMHKNNIQALLSELIVKYLNNKKNISCDQLNNIETPIFEKVSSAISLFLNKPSQVSYETVRAESQKILNLLPFFPNDEKFILNQLGTVPISSLMVFNRQITNHPYISYGAIILICVFIFNVMNSDFFMSNIGIIPFAIILITLIYNVPQIVESVYTASMSYNSKLNDLLESSSFISLMKNKLLMFSNANPTEGDILLVGPLGLEPRTNGL